MAKYGLMQKTDAALGLVREFVPVSNPLTTSASKQTMKMDDAGQVNGLTFRHGSHTLSG